MPWMNSESLAMSHNVTQPQMSLTLEDSEVKED